MCACVRVHVCVQALFCALGEAEGQVRVSYLNLWDELGVVVFGMGLAGEHGDCKILQARF